MAEQDAARLLRRAARRVSDDPSFLGAALAAYQAAHALSDEALAQRLGCPPAALPRLALCRWPDGASPAFRAQVEQIATYSGARALALASLLREVEVSGSFRGAAGEAAALLAARDGETALPDAARAEAGDAGASPPEEEGGPR